MPATVGSGSLLIALVLSVWGFIAGMAGARTQNARLVASSRGAVVGAALAVVVASLALWSALLGSDWNLAYVVQVTSLTLPTLYKFAAFWSGFAGSLLLWTLILSLYAAINVLWPHRRARPFLPVATVVFLGVMIFFLLVLNFLASPFTTMTQQVLDGSGLDPLLQYPEMAIHPVLLYLGFVGMTVPFAFGMAGLYLGREGRDWLAVTRKTTLVAWLFLSAGIVLGAHWSYRVLGWGGYWAWDPVENAALLPWIAGTAFLHSSVMQERRGMMRGWNVLLVLVTFLLTIFGTFLTRSGVVTSIHAFTGTTVWPAFLAFLGICLGVSLWMLIRRWRSVQEAPLGTEIVSKESSFLFNNLLLIAAAVAVLWGTVFPLVSEAVLGQTITPGVSFYNGTFGPLFLAVVVLMGICPLIPWRRATAGQLARNLWPPLAVGVAVGLATGIGTASSGAGIALGAVGMALFTMLGEFWKAARLRIRHMGEGAATALYRVFSTNRKRYGGYIVHIGILILVVGVVGTQWLARRATFTLAPGAPARLGAYTFTLEGVTHGFDGPYPQLTAIVRVTSAGQQVAMLAPSQVTYPTLELPMGKPDIASFVLTDIYVVLSGTEGTSATLLVILNPLASWIWAGAVIIVAGIVIALGFRPEDRAHPVARKSKGESLAWPT